MRNSVQVGPHPRLIAVSGSSSIPGYLTVVMDGSDHFTIDLGASGSGNGDKSFIVVLDTTTSVGTFIPPIYTGGTIVAGLTFDLYVGQSSPGAFPMPAFSTATGGFTSTAAAQAQIGPDTGLYTYIKFKYHGSKWGIDIVNQGVSLT